jgi:hypothetical protein
MTDADRFKLIGTYKSPRVRVGADLTCEARDCDVIVTGYTDARIPWPVGRQRGRGKSGIIVFGALIDAIRKESGQAVGYWWGVSSFTTAKWRKAFAVPQSNDGTHRLRVKYNAEPWAVQARKKAHAKARDLERRQKIGDAKRGKSLPPHVVDAMRKGRSGIRHTAAARAKMRAERQARLATGWRAVGQAWGEAEDEMVRTLPAQEVMARTGRTLSSVYNRRVRLRVPDGRTG